MLRLRAGSPFLPAVVAIGSFAVTSATSCREPTEITVTVMTDANCSDLHGVTIAVGTLGDSLEALPPTSVSTQCDDATKRIGALVIVPSGGKSDDVAFRVVAGFGKSVDQCVAPFRDSGCIVARRALRFVPATPLSVPVTMSVSCAGIPCDATSTCQNGRCVPATSLEPGPCTSASGCGTTDSGAPSPFTGCGDTSGAQASSPWPMGGGCPTHTGRSPNVATQTPVQKWSFPTRNAMPINSFPSIGADGTLYFGSKDAYAYAVRPDGTKRWEWAEPTMTEVGGDTAIGADGKVFVSSQVGVYALDSATGKMLWTNPGNASDITVAGGEVVLVGTQGHVTASTASGDPVWSAPLSGLIVTAPTVDPVTAAIYVAADDGTLYALDGTTHATLWTYPIAGQPSTPSYVNGALLAVTASNGGRLVSVDARTGAKKWDVPGVTRFCQAVAADGTVYAVFGTELRAYGANGMQKWSADTAGAITSCPLVDGAGVVLVDNGAELMALEPTAGTKLWSVAAPDGSGIVIAADGTIYVATQSGTLLAFGAR